MSSNGTLPEDILIDILSRLPVKPLCRFKCVSPSWNSLISDPYFTKTHLKQSNTPKNHEHLYHNKIIMSTYHNLYSVDFTNLLNPTITKLDFPNMAYHAAIRCCCEGLLLASNNDRSILFLLNPSTRECNKVTVPPLALDPVCKIRWSLYGLGYDSSIDYYKVVIISQHKTEFSPGLFMVLDVYSLKTNAWRRIKCPGYWLMGNSRGVFLKGCIHCPCWTATSTPQVMVMVMIAFDLSDEVFREVPLPASFRKCESIWYDVEVFGGCLYLVNRRETEVWMMKEYGVRESWTEITICSGLPAANLLCLLAEDEFLLTTSGEKLKQMVVYNQKKDTARDVVVCGLPPRFSFEGTYVESLISPHHRGGIQRH